MPTLRQTIRLAGPIVKSLRPHQWVKNVFVLAPVVFSLKIFSDPVALLRSSAAFALFCLAAGAVYLVNDVLDIEDDRAHPVKRLRPVAAGTLPLGMAIRAATTLVGRLRTSDSAAAAVVRPAAAGGAARRRERSGCRRVTSWSG